MAKLLEAAARMKEMMLRHFQAGWLARRDGGIFHENRSWKPYSFGQQEIAARLKDEGIPCILLDGDMADERDFAEGSWRTRLEALDERLDGRAHPGRLK